MLENPESEGDPTQKDIPEAVDWLYRLLTLDHQVKGLEIVVPSGSLTGSGN